MADPANVSGVLAHYDSMEGTRQAILALREAGFEDLEVFSPVMCEPLEEALGIYSSPVRRWALIGGMTGFATANLLTIGTSLSYPLIGQGKPIVSWPPFIVIMFELTILYTGLFAMFSWMVHAHRPKLKLSPAYRAVFSVDRWGIFVPVEDRDRDRAIEKVRETEPVEVEA
jgi:molybdopterin-containing oxidoreductase family membrane subunit